jgi:hypothetical protein
VLAPLLDGVVDGWYLIGAQAALIRGSRRLSSDIDITVISEHESPKMLVANMRSAGFELRVPDVEDFVAVTRVLPFVYLPTQMPVDLVFGGPGLEALILHASERLDLDGVLVPVPTAEHLILLKLFAGRPKDFEDAAAMARANDVDFDAIELLAKAIADDLGEHDILAALAQLRRTLAKR